MKVFYLLILIVIIDCNSQELNYKLTDFILWGETKEMMQLNGERSNKSYTLKLNYKLTNLGNVDVRIIKTNTILRITESGQKLSLDLGDYIVFRKWLPEETKDLNKSGIWNAKKETESENWNKNEYISVKTSHSSNIINKLFELNPDNVEVVLNLKVFINDKDKFINYSLQPKDVTNTWNQF